MLFHAGPVQLRDGGVKPFRITVALIKSRTDWLLIISCFIKKMLGIL